MSGFLLDQLGLDPQTLLPQDLLKETSEADVDELNEDLVALSEQSSKQMVTRILMRKTFSLLLSLLR